jgi:hypothetical protein
MGLAAFESGVVASTLDAATGLNDGRHCLAERAQAGEQGKRASRQDRLEAAQRVGWVGPQVRPGVQRLRIGGDCQQHKQVVGQDLGGEVLLEGQVGQAAGGFSGAGDA